MELKDLLKLFKKNKKALYLWAFFGALLGTVIYFLPTKYLSIGSFYIKRSADTSLTFFTYEGYYSQQTALSYTNTVAALLESVDLQSRALEKLGIPVNETTLRHYSKLIKVKKAGPQLVTLTVKGGSGRQAQLLWNALSDELITTVKQINADGDNKLSADTVSEQPVVRKSYKSLAINIPAGIILFTLAGIFFIAIKEYD